MLVLLTDAVKSEVRCAAWAKEADILISYCRDYELSVEDLRDWEEKNGEVPDNAVVLMETGWGDKYGNSEAYLGG